jgi:hypothetical protein
MVKSISKPLWVFLKVEMYLTEISPSITEIKLLNVVPSSSCLVGSEDPSAPVLPALAA